MENVRPEFVVTIGATYFYFLRLLMNKFAGDIDFPLKTQKVFVPRNDETRQYQDENTDEFRSRVRGNPQSTLNTIINFGNVDPVPPKRYIDESTKEFSIRQDEFDQAILKNKILEEEDAKNQEKYDEIMQRRFVYLVIASVSSIILGTLVLTTKHKHTHNIGLAIVFAGIALLLEQLVMNWWKVKDNMRLLVIGGAMIILMGGSIKFSRK